jgi:ubiquinone/menaquinone biosynthesis C-methylase UbiE
MRASALLNIEKLFDDVGLTRGMRVADFGAGASGHLVFPAAKRVGEDGRVYAVDIQKDALQMIEGRRRQFLVHNLDTVWGDFEHPGGVAIDEGSLDIAFLINSLWVMKNHLSAAAEMKRLLAPNGKIVVIDWLPNVVHPVAPPPRVRLHPNTSDVYFVSGGLDHEEDFKPSPFHFGKVYRLT